MKKFLVLALAATMLTACGAPSEEEIQAELDQIFDDAMQELDQIGDDANKELDAMVEDLGEIDLDSETDDFVFYDNLKELKEVAGQDLRDLDGDSWEFTSGSIYEGEYVMLDENAKYADYSYFNDDYDSVDFEVLLEKGHSLKDVCEDCEMKELDGVSYALFSFGDIDLGVEIFTEIDGLIYNVSKFEGEKYISSEETLVQIVNDLK